MAKNKKKQKVHVFGDVKIPKDAIVTDSSLVDGEGSTNPDSRKCWEGWDGGEEACESS